MEINDGGKTLKSRIELNLLFPTIKYITHLSLSKADSGPSQISKTKLNKAGGGGGGGGHCIPDIGPGSGLLASVCLATTFTTYLHSDASLNVTMI